MIITSCHGIDGLCKYDTDQIKADINKWILFTCLKFETVEKGSIVFRDKKEGWELLSCWSHSISRGGYWWHWCIHLLVIY